MASSTDKRNSLSGTLERGLAILEFFAATGEASAVMVADALGLSRSATYRILDALQEKGYLEINPSSEKLRLGVRAAELGMAALEAVDVIRLAPAYMRDLAQAASETAFLAVVDGDAIVYVYKEEGPEAVTLSSSLGSRRPLYCTGLGKAYLSALPEDERKSILASLDLRKMTENTITDITKLEEELSLTWERGYAIDNIEVEEGVACFAAPILDYRGRPVAAISVAGPAERVLSKGEKLRPLIAGTASKISHRMGYIKSLKGVG
jgi:IclR family transcriptional regulator, acetate operon repressor